MLSIRASTFERSVSSLYKELHLHSNGIEYSSMAWRKAYQDVEKEGRNRQENSKKPLERENQAERDAGRKGNCRFPCSQRERKGLFHNGDKVFPPMLRKRTLAFKTQGRFVDLLHNLPTKGKAKLVVGRSQSFPIR